MPSKENENQGMIVERTVSHSNSGKSELKNHRIQLRKGSLSGKTHVSKQRFIWEKQAKIERTKKRMLRNLKPRPPNKMLVSEGQGNNKNYV